MRKKKTPTGRKTSKRQKGVQRDTELLRHLMSDAVQKSIADEPHRRPFSAYCDDTAEVCGKTDAEIEAEIETFAIPFRDENTAVIDTAGILDNLPSESNRKFTVLLDTMTREQLIRLADALKPNGVVVFQPRR